jgi:uncharacterized protein YeaO (DUF488 family)
VQVRIKRIYDPPSSSDGLRVVVDRLWPRGVKKQEAAADVWAKELAPSDKLRRWFAHKDDRFEEFARRYRIELAKATADVDELLASAGGGAVTLLYAAANRTCNHAVVLQAWLHASLDNRSKGDRAMTSPPTQANDHEAITQVVQHYLDGAKSGKGDDMKPAFHEAATMFGYVGADLFAGPIRQLFDWNDKNGPATDLQARIADIDVAESVATVRLELDNWTGQRFTDMFTLLKVDGEWKIINKVFHLHA